MFGSALLNDEVQEVNNQHSQRMSFCTVSTGSDCVCVCVCVCEVCVLAVCEGQRNVMLLPPSEYVCV